MADILVIGMGNLIMGDDAVGPLAVRELSERLAGHSRSIHYIENYTCGLDLLGEIDGYKTVVFIDSLESGNETSGECIEFSLDEIKNIEYGNLSSSHGINLPLLLELGARLKLDLPRECIIYGIVIDRSFEFSEELSDPVKNGFNRALTSIETKLIELVSPACREI